MSKSDEAKARELRLAEKLRDNLRRRKAQLKARKAEGNAGDDAAAAPRNDPDVKGGG